MAFVLGLAREFRRADWRRWLSSMSCTEFKTWADYYATRPFFVDLVDCEFASLKLNQFLLAGGKSDEVSMQDFSLITAGDEALEPEEDMGDDQIMAAATFIPGGVRFGQ
ncbi:MULTISPECIES: phage tail assembly protein T [Edwardsiella]|uniref:Phage tail assembly protein T n=1 Tax=Edwardsiella anguillarum TaxID=1821960 RepID=A0ABY8SAZ2_9GAMM|nr:MULTISPECIES: phage tail assembly protein T [Edwardsiella]AKR78401.1 phage tail assembly protein T [Edwardsiella sp. LADL05-105]KAB0593566.1 phage tail assembly protein T [Edwardsiella anguillarum]UOU78139.1 phage tail assembly protein T [Edwardsiella anguillarum]WHP82907.1 phage tail assembly protein T [Edwardsiella anguillarum]WHP86704.1 phage tail assembly protein T [Edwardsiella anguillarum]